MKDFDHKNIIEKKTICKKKDIVIKHGNHHRSLRKVLSIDERDALENDFFP